MMMNLFKRIFFILTFSFMLICTYAATITYQSTIVTSSGDFPQDGSYGMRFSLWNALADQTPENNLWQEEYLTGQAVDIKKGFFQIELGSITPFAESFFQDNPNLWLQVEANLTGTDLSTTEAFSPRSKITFAPLALFAEKAQKSADSDQLAGNTASYYLDASNISAGTLSNDRFDAYSNLDAKSKIGSAADQLAQGSHQHSQLTVKDTPSQIALQADEAGKIGIGTNEPSAELEVAGKVKATEFEGNLTGQLTPTAPVLLGNQQIKEAAAPTEAMDVTNKEYVDTTLDVHSSDATIHFTENSIDHANIQNAGIKTHAELDTHVDDATVHFTETSIDHANIQNAGAKTHAELDTHVDDTTVHFTETSIDHANIQNAGAKTHAELDTHVDDATVHFTETSIDHANIQNAGAKTHAELDTHVDDATVHFTEGSIDHKKIRNTGLYSHTSIDQHILNNSIHPSFSNKALLDAINQGLAKTSSPTFAAVNTEQIESISDTVIISDTLSMNGNAIEDIASPVNDEDAANKAYVDQENLAQDTDITTHTADGTIHFTESSIDHNNIQNTGTNSHAQIDTHMADGSIHQSFSNKTVLDVIDQELATTSSPAFAAVSTDQIESSGDSVVISDTLNMNWHNIQNVNGPMNDGDATNKAYVDQANQTQDTALSTHTEDAAIHFTEASIDHSNIQNAGVNTHAQIDTHMADGTIHQSFSNKAVLDVIDQELATTSSPAFAAVSTDQIESSGDTVVISDTLNMNDNPIINVANPTDPDDAVNKGYLDDEITVLDTRISDNESLLSDHETRIQDNEGNIFDNESLIADNDGRISDNETAINSHIADTSIHQSFSNKAVLDVIDQELAMTSSPAFAAVNTDQIESSGDTVVISDTLNMNDNPIINVANPTDPDDAVNKGYVDDEITVLDTRISDNESLLSDHETRIQDNEGNIFDNESRIIQNESDIQFHDGRISDNETDINIHIADTSIHQSFSNKTFLDSINQELATDSNPAFAAVNTSWIEAIDSDTVVISDTVRLYGHQITDLGTPTSDYDAANKAYVDSVAGGSGGGESATCYGDGSAGTQTIGTVNWNTNPPTGMNTQFENLTINGTLTVPSGTVIRCTGTFTMSSSGSIVVNTFLKPGSEIPEGIASDAPDYGSGGIGLNSAFQAAQILSPGLIGGGPGESDAFDEGAIGGEGGGTICIRAKGNIIIQSGGSIHANGQSSPTPTPPDTNTYQSGSGGGGGGIIIIASSGTITAAGTVSAKGGNGGIGAENGASTSSNNAGRGGGGGGGIVHFITSNTVTQSGTITTAGGSKGSHVVIIQAGNTRIAKGAAGGASAGNGGDTDYVSSSGLVLTATDGSSGFVVTSTVDPTTLY